LFHPAKKRLRSSLQQFSTWATVAVLVACTLGIPLPLRVEKTASKSSAEPYPCQNCPCGCANAEMCWRNCCCQTQQEKLAWAKKNGVTPPDYVVAAAKVEQRLVRRPSAAKSSAPKCCCCKAKSCSPKPEVARAANSSTTRVVMFQALKCQGLGPHWVSLPPPLPESNAVFTLELLPLEGVAMATLDFSSYLAPPATPPPQFS